MTPTFMIALQVGAVSEHMDQARELVKLIVEIEPEPRPDIEFALCVSRSVNRPYVLDVMRLVSQRFKNNFVIRSHRFGGGWPMGCNDLWQETMMQLHALSRSGHIKSDGVLTFEPDCIPLRPDWLNKLKEAWRIAKDAKKLVTGHAHNNPHTHINGNAIFHINLMGMHEGLKDCDALAGWDIYHAPFFLRVGLDTPMIFQRYRIQDISIPEIRAIRKDDQVPALFHGIKTMAGIENIRRMLISGIFDQRVRKELNPDEEFHESHRAEQQKRPAHPETIRFSISILALNKLDLTKACVQSVLTNSSPCYELLLWDNGSTDGTWEYFESLMEKYPRIRARRSETNLGFMEPNRENLKIANGKYFVMLNNDARVPRGWLEHLEKPFLEHPRAALSGPSGTCCELGPDFHGRPGHNLEYIEGSCLCAPVRLLRAHGLFSDELRFAYGEDCDLSLRMREKGYTLHHAPFRIEHVGSATSRELPEIKEVQRYNHDALQRRWGHYMKVRRMDYPILIKRRASLGDVLLTTPIIRALKQQRPTSQLIVETDLPEIFRDNPNVDSLHIKLDQIPAHTLTIDLNMAYEKRLNTSILKAYEDEAGIVCPSRHLDLFVNHVEQQWARKHIPDHTHWCALGCTETTWPGKNWPRENWMTLTEELLGLGWKVVLIGRGHLENFPADLNLINRTTLHGLAAILTRCGLFIGHDSFPLHCSIGRAKKTIGLFGVTLPEMILPVITPSVRGVASNPEHPGSGLRHKVAGQTYVECPSNPMETISVEQVLQEIQDVIGLLGPNSRAAHPVE
jgi:ADP-heptose:LPS heptosyltransferase/glycosyltransferase involved in cell wall biosynthesis